MLARNPIMHTFITPIITTSDRAVTAIMDQIDTLQHINHKPVVVELIRQQGIDIWLSIWH